MSKDQLIPSCKAIHCHSSLHEPLVLLQDDVGAITCLPALQSTQLPRPPENTLGGILHGPSRTKN